MLADWQHRVIEERDELEKKVNRLSSFFTTGAWRAMDPEGQSLMRQQALLMEGYLAVLQQRIEKFGDAA